LSQSLGARGAVALRLNGDVLSLVAKLAQEAREALFSLPLRGGTVCFVREVRLIMLADFPRVIKVLTHDGLET
jgi:hypothetical protein